MAITHIFHAADLHVRAGDRERARIDEYTHVLWEFLKDVREHPATRAGTALVVLAGDLFHTKNRVDSEGAGMIFRWLGELLDVCPVVAICGNHDYRQEAPHLRDMIEVLATAFEGRGKGFTYLRDSGVHTYKNVAFGVVTVKDTLRATSGSGVVAELPPYPKAPAGTAACALFHGSVRDSGTHGQYPLEWISSAGWKIGLFGDNHLQQMGVHGGMHWGYPGSLVQQDDGEPTRGHGYILWDLENSMSTVYNIPNPYGAVTMRVRNGGIQVRFGAGDIVAFDDPATVARIPAQAKVRVVGTAGDLEIVREALAKINIKPTKIHLKTSVGVTVFGDAQAQAAETPDAPPVGDEFFELNSIDHWKQYVSARNAADLYITDPRKLLVPACTAVQDAVTGRNATLSKLLERYEQTRHAAAVSRNRIAFKSMTWSYLMCYGPDNVFDFERADNSVVLLNGPNACGKSAFVDVLCIALYGSPTGNRRLLDKSDVKILHDNLPMGAKGQVKLSFTLNGEIYEITRSFGVQTRGGVDYIRALKFEVAHAGKIIAENAVAKEWISKYFGTIDDMMMSTILCQFDNTNFFMQPAKTQMDIIDRTLNMESINEFGALLKESDNAHAYVIGKLESYMAGLKAQAGGEAAPDADTAADAEREAFLSKECDRLAAFAGVRLGPAKNPGKKRDMSVTECVEVLARHDLIIASLEREAKSIGGWDGPVCEGDEEPGTPPAMLPGAVRQRLQALGASADPGNIRAELERVKRERDDLEANAPMRPVSCAGVASPQAPDVEPRVPVWSRERIAEKMRRGSEYDGELRPLAEIYADLEACSNEPILGDDPKLPAEFQRIAVKLFEDQDELERVIEIHGWLSAIQKNPRCWACRESPALALRDEQDRKLDALTEEIYAAADVLDKAAVDPVEVSKVTQDTLRRRVAYERRQELELEFQRALRAELRAHDLRDAWTRAVWEKHVAKLKAAGARVEALSQELAQAEQNAKERGQLEKMLKTGEEWVARRRRVLREERARALDRHAAAAYICAQGVRELSAYRAELSEIRARLAEARARAKAAAMARAGAEDLAQLRARAADIARLKLVFVGPTTAAGLASGVEGYKSHIYKDLVAAALEKEVNRFLETIDTVRLRIAYSKGALVYKTEDRGNSPSLDNASGYQKFIIGLAMRMALARLGAIGHSVRHLFIDEGFAACDAENIQKAGEMLECMMTAGGYSSIILMSHLETIRDAARLRADILRDGPYARLQWRKNNAT